MIGFREQSVVRRPIYSTTGSKLGYLVSDPGGDWWISLNGRRIARIKHFRRPAIPKEISTSLAGTVYVTVAEIDENC